MKLAMDRAGSYNTPLIIGVTAHEGVLVCSRKLRMNEFKLLFTPNPDPAKY